MSNRRKITPSPRLLAAARCPDCDSRTRPAGRDEFGIHHVIVSHDDTCPTWRRLQELDAAGLTQLRLLGEADQ